MKVSFESWNLDVSAQFSPRARRGPRAAGDVTAGVAVGGAGLRGRSSLKISKAPSLPPCASPAATTAPAASVPPRGFQGENTFEGIRKQRKGHAQISTSGTMRAFLYAAVGELLEKLERY